LATLELCHTAQNDPLIAMTATTWDRSVASTAVGMINVADGMALALAANYLVVSDTDYLVVSDTDLVTDAVGTAVVDASPVDQLFKIAM
jgi:hypothetical protein